MKNYGVGHPEVNLLGVKDISADPNGLSPVRQTTRPRPPIDYNQLSRGNHFGGNDEDVDDKGLENGETSLNRSISKDPKKGNHQAKRNVVQENKAKLENLFNNMKKHEFAYLLNQPLLESHPSYEQVKHNFSTLSMMDLHFKIGNKYINSS